MCKSGDTFSLAVLIDRGLDLQIRRCNRMFFGDARCDARHHSRLLLFTSYLSFFVQFSGPRPFYITADESLWFFVFYLGEWSGCVDLLAFWENI